MPHLELRPMTVGELGSLRKVRRIWLLVLLFLFLFAAATIAGVGVKKAPLYGSFALLVALGPLWGFYSTIRVLRNGRVTLMRLRVREAMIGGRQRTVSFDDPEYGRMGVSVEIYRSLKVGDEVEIARSAATGRVVSVNGIPLGW